MKEQEVIKRLNFHKEYARLYSSRVVMISETDLETVLNMLKEKDKEIEHWKNGFERELEDNRKNTCELLKQDLIIREKDKQIDLMAFNIADYVMYYEYDKCRSPLMIKDKSEELKEYYERKATNDG